MKSYNESLNTVEYKSGLELKSFRYCDSNPLIKKWSCEPFHIKYYKTITQKVHRYFPDLYIEFKSGQKFIVEIKSYSETIPPKKPKKITKKSEANYIKALQTYKTNTDKWSAAEKFAKVKNINFIILTERELK